MNTYNVTTKQVSAARPDYYNVYINGKPASEIKHPSSNPYLKRLSLDELAEVEAKRIKGY
jgi:hypothetical protein